MTGHLSVSSPESVLGNPLWQPYELQWEKAPIGNDRFAVAHFTTLSFLKSHTLNRNWSPPGFSSTTKTRREPRKELGGTMPAWYPLHSWCRRIAVATQPWHKMRSFRRLVHEELVERRGRRWCLPSCHVLSRPSPLSQAVRLKLKKTLHNRSSRGTDRRRIESRVVMMNLSFEHSPTLPQE